ESRHDLGGGIQDGFANVIFIGNNSAAVIELDRFAEHAFQVRPASLHIKAMAGITAELLEQSFSALREGSGCLASTKPCLVLSGFHHHHLADHAGMLSATVFRAEKMVGTRLRRMEPHGGVAAG